MPVPLVPYPPQAPMPPPGTQGQLVCIGCRTLLVYPQGASNVRCALCSSVTPVPAPGTEMAQIVCGGCRTWLMYIRGASSVQCSCCHTINIAMEANQVAHISCGGCSTTLMYAYGAHSVKCALCQYVTTLPGVRFPGPPGIASAPAAAPAPTTPDSTTSSMRPQTVVVQNPMTVDETGKLVSSVAVGVTATDKK